MTAAARRLLGAVGLPALLGLIVLAWVAVAAISDARRAHFDFKPGLVFDYLVQASPGDPQHHVRVVLTEVSEDGYKVAIRMPEVNVDATQTVSRLDRLAGRCIPGRTYSGDATQAGCVNWIRPSDVIYRDLKAGRVTEIDANPTSGPPTLTTQMGAGRIRIIRDGRPTYIRAVSGFTADGNYAFNDDPAFPFSAFGLIEVWSPATLGPKLQSDLTWRGKAATTALIFTPDNKLDPLSETLLGYIADWLKAHPDKHLQLKVITDDLLSRDDAVQLAMGRASALSADLRARGIERKRIIAIAAGHDYWPTPDTLRQGQAERVEFKVVTGDRPS